MIPEAKKDVLATLNDAYDAIKVRQHFILHSISDHVIHAMSIYLDSDIVDVAVAVYSLDKILESERYARYPKIKEFVSEVLYFLKDAAKALGEDDIDKFRREIRNLLGAIQALTKKLKFYTEDVLQFAKIKKGSKLYEHGLSLGTAAAAMGITKWDLMPATGETVVHEKYVEPIALDKERLKFIKKIFKVKS
ncbi:MAG: hypothetical protein V1839_00030 [archaeon]